MNITAPAARAHSLRRRTATLLLAAAAAAALVSTAGVSPAGASVSGIGVGTTSCTAGYNGVMTFSPALVNGGTAPNVVVTLKLGFTGCSGGTPVPVSGTYVAKGVVTEPGANNCANWFAPAGPGPVIPFPSAHLDGDVAWSPSSISNSNVSFSHMRIWTSLANRLLIRLPAAASTVTLSYASTANLWLRAAQLYPTVAAECAGPGVPNLKIVPANPSSVLSHGTW